MSVLSAVKNKQTKNAVCILLWFFPGVRVVLSEILMLREVGQDVDQNINEHRPERRA